jgi:hypothetical protein
MAIRLSNAICDFFTSVTRAGVKGLIEKFLPVIVMIIALALVPGLLYTINSKESWVAYSHITTSMVYSHFYFLWWNLFLVVVLAGSVLNELDKITSSVSDIPSALGLAIPSNAIFFTVYIMSLGVAGLPSKLSQIGGYVAGNIFRKYLCKTEREMEEAMKGAAFDIAVEVPMFIVILCMTLTYMVIAPIILPCACFYFGFGYLVNKSMLLTNTNTGRAVMLWDPLEYDGAGKAFQAAVTCTMVSILTAAIFNCFYFGVRESWVAMALIICVCPYILYVWCNVGPLLNSGNCLYPDKNHWNVEYSDVPQGSAKRNERTAKDDDIELKEIFEQQPRSSTGDQMGNIPLLTNTDLKSADTNQICYYQRPCLLNAPNGVSTFSYTQDTILSDIGAAAEATPRPTHQEPKSTPQQTENPLTKQSSKSHTASEIANMSNDHPQPKSPDPSGFSPPNAQSLAVRDQILRENLSPHPRSSTPKTPDQEMQEEHDAWNNPEDQESQL